MNRSIKSVTFSHLDGIMSFHISSDASSSTISSIVTRPVVPPYSSTMIAISCLAHLLEKYRCFNRLQLRMQPALHRDLRSCLAHYIVMEVLLDWEFRWYYRDHLQTPGVSERPVSLNSFSYLIDRGEPELDSDDLFEVWLCRSLLSQRTRLH